jgi:uncharacterized protein
VNDSVYFIRITPDLLTVTLHHGRPEGEVPVIASGEELKRWCTDKGIDHGLDPGALAEAALRIDRGEAFSGAMLLAAGTPPVAACKDMRPCFTPLTLIIDAADEKGEIRQMPLTLVPLVRPGTILIESTPPRAPQPGIDVFGREIAATPTGEQTFTAGDLVEDNQAQQRLVAQASGYPRLSEQRKGTGTQVTVSIDKLIQVSTDKMQAVLALRPPLPGHPRLDLQTLHDILDEEGIIFGRLPNATAQCLEQPPGMLPVRSSAVIALGTLPVKGKDAWLRFTMEVGPLPGKIMGNGEIDFRERNMFVGVDKDQVIAVRVPPTEGTPGRDLFGNSVAQTPGRDLTVKVTDDAVFDPESGEISAGRAGVLSMVSEHSVKVSSRQVIGSDIDFTTGNLISRNALEIKGSVKPKFRVNALGDILIHGNVEKSQIRSDSNVVIRSGMLGEQAAIHARGEVDISFIEHGSIIAGGAIIVRKNAYFCRLHTNANLCCDPSSRIIASQLVAGGSITTGTVGSNNADPCLLAAAVLPHQWQQYTELQRIIAQQEYTEKRLRMKIGPRGDSEQLEDLVNALQENKRQLAQLNLILAESGPAADTGLAHALACRITIKGTVFAGTEIRIGNSRMVLPVGKENICFYLRNPGAGEEAGLPTDNDIMSIPLKN